jgi:hypothetical protein
MVFDSFKNLVNQAIDAARNGTELSEPLYRSILEIATPACAESQPESFAVAVRQLGIHCDLGELSRVCKMLDSGANSESIEHVIQHNIASRKAFFEEAACDESVKACVEAVAAIRESEENFFTQIRKLELLMGFDQVAMNGLIEMIGSFDDTKLPGRLVDILPEEISFPIRDHDETRPYDHRLHLLVRELILLMREESRWNEDIIKHCGHILSAVCHADDEEAASTVSLHQLTILADEYVRRNSSDVIGYCWRGELACWVGDDELAHEYARRLWDETRSGSTGTILRATGFLALTGRSAPDGRRGWWSNVWSRGSHLGELKRDWLDHEQPLVWAMVRNAFQRGGWDMPLLCTIMALNDNGYLFSGEPDDASVPAWVWMAENADLTHYGSESYHLYWSNAFEGLREDTEQGLAHNVIAATLAGLLFTESKRHGFISASIQQVLESLDRLHRSGSMPEKYAAALELLSDKYSDGHFGNLIAADRAAIQKAIESLKSLRRIAAGGGSSRPDDGYAPLKRISQILLTDAENSLRLPLTEAVWSRLSPKAKNEFRNGEHHYRFARDQEGEGGDFNSFVNCYSKGLLSEIQESLKGPLMRDPSLQNEFRTLFGEDVAPEWGRLVRWIDTHGTQAAPKLTTKLLAQGVKLNRLDMLRAPFKRLKVCRNKAAHTADRVDREEAAVLRDLLLNKGLIRDVVEIFRKAPRR